MNEWNYEPYAIVVSNDNRYMILNKIHLGYLKRIDDKPVIAGYYKYLNLCFNFSFDMITMGYKGVFENNTSLSTDIFCE